MSERPLLSARIATWTREAVQTWGYDWARIAEHIERRRTALDPSESHDVAEETALTLIGGEEGAQH
jgi:hypothetical protein